MRTLRVVVIDDSAFNRRTIIQLLEEIPGVEVVGYAVDGENGIRRVIDLKPDLVTLDLEMPKMDGFTLIRIIMSNCPTPIIVVSSQNDKENVLKALDLGAVDFVAKPENNISENLLTIREALHQKVLNVFNLSSLSRTRPESEVFLKKMSRDSASIPSIRERGPVFDIVAIGSSTGGPPALQKIIKAFPEKIPFAVLISQHMPSGFTKAFAERLNRKAGFVVSEAVDGEIVTPGKILIAPGGRNMLFEQHQGMVRVKLKFPDHLTKYVPSVDAMFTSLAEIYRKRLLAVVLTGMGSDGAEGVKKVKSAGGEILAESEESSVVFGMPREAIATGLVSKVSHLDQIAAEILLRCGIINDTVRD